jgi:sulfate transport system ATP-binding protein
MSTTSQQPSLSHPSSLSSPLSRSGSNPFLNGESTGASARAGSPDAGISLEPRSIRIRDLSKRYGCNLILSGIDLAIAPGELLALLGPSGSGKTTLLRLIAGLDTITSGSLLFDAEDATEFTIQERRVGFVFQNYALFRHMTVSANIAYGLTVRPRRLRPPRDEIERRVNALLEVVQLTGLGGRYPSQLSGGQKQRVAFARALAIEPRVLLLDEPFGALDAKVRKELRTWLHEIHTRTKVTTIFVTHDQAEAMEIADRVAIMNKGRIEQVGSPREVTERPKTEFVQAFLS